MPRALSELTLDELVALLIAGEAVEHSGGAEFRLGNADSRALLAFYNQDRRAYWNPDRDTAIREGEVDKLLNALDAPFAAPPLPRVAAPGRSRWRLTKVEAHRFRGLHRHCATDGRDPTTFALEFEGDISLFRGFNGAGKTSLLSAICWCLTGIGYRAQALPASLHDSIEVKVSAAGGAQDQEAATTFSLPPLVPVPSDEELLLVDGNPKVDTWVRLTLRSVDDAATTAMVERRMLRDRRGSISVVETGLNELGLGDLAIQAGTVMPAIASAMRFDDKTTLSMAVSVLTGLRPLSRFGERCERLRDRLSGKFTKEASDARDEAATVALKQVQTLRDLLAVNMAVPALGMIQAPNAAAPDAWIDGIALAKNTLDKAEATAKVDAESILGTLPLLTSDEVARRFVADLDAAETLLSGAALRALPSMGKAIRLGQLDAGEIAAAEAEIASVIEEAQRVAAGFTDERRWRRLRLYNLVARWHEEHHPGEPIGCCPVCGADLSDEALVPPDALLDMGVVEALEACRRADAAAAKTSTEWERERAQEFLARLPEQIRSFAAEQLPKKLADLYGNAIVNELFSVPEMPQSVRALSRNINAIWVAATAEAPEPAAAPNLEIPAVFPNGGGLRRYMTAVDLTLRLSRSRAAEGQFFEQALKRTLKEVPDRAAIPAAEQPFKEQIAILRRFAQSAQAFGAVRRKVSQIEATCRIWAAKRDRLTKLARAAAAVEPFTRFPNMVQGQIGGLIVQLNDRATWWANQIYRAQFLGAPSYAGLDPDDTDAFALLAASGSHRIQAHHVLNASALRAFLWAFVLTLWEQIWARSGGISCLLMDDAQDLLDPANVANMAAAVPSMLAAGMNPLVASNDFGFLASVEGHVKAAGGGRPYRIDGWEFSAISRSKCTASMSPLMDEVRVRCQEWQTTNENDPALARKFVHPVRVRIETKLWDLLGDDPAVLESPTLSDLLQRIQQVRGRGERPFNEEPFRKLVEMPCLQPGGRFREIINRAHHGRADQITPAEAEVVREHHIAVLDAIDAC